MRRDSGRINNTIKRCLAVLVFFVLLFAVAGAKGEFPLVQADVDADGGDSGILAAYEDNEAYGYAKDIWTDGVSADTDAEEGDFEYAKMDEDEAEDAEDENEDDDDEIADEEAKPSYDADEMPGGELSGVTESGICVYADFSEGVFPKDTVMQLRDVSRESVLGELAGLGYEVRDLAAVDITFFDADWEEIQPREGSEVFVSLVLDEPLAGEDPAVVHIGDDGSVDVLEDEDIGKTSSVQAQFFASEFSTYVLLETASNYLPPATDAWYGDYEYSINNDDRTITLTRYIGEDTELIVPTYTRIDIDSDLYTTVLSGNVYYAQKNISQIDFQEGTRLSEDVSSMFSGCMSLTSVDLSGLDATVRTAANGGGLSWSPCG